MIKENEEDFINLSGLQQKYIITFLIALVCSALAYGFELSNHTISIDVDVMDNYLHTIDLGRWGHAILKRFVFHEPWVPFFSLVFSLICISAASVASSIYLKLTKEESIIFSSLFVTFPQMAYQLQFSNQAETVGLALLLSVYSMIFFDNGSRSGKAIFILLNIFVISIYQSFVFLPITLLSINHLKLSLTEKSGWKSWICNSIILSLLSVVSVTIYLIISKQVKSYYHINDVSYFAALIAWGKMSAIDAIIGVYKFILYNCYLVTWYGFNLYFLTAISIVVVVLSSLKFGIKKAAFTLFLSIIVLLCPFILNILIGAGTPARTLSQMPIVFAATVTMGVMWFSNKTLRLISTLIIAISSCAYVNMLFYSDKVAEDQTKYLSQQLMTDIYHSYPEKMQYETPVYFSGRIKIQNPWRQNGSDEFGISFLERGESDRVGNYIRNTGMANIIQVGKYSISNEQKLALRTMPSWPSSGSIKDVAGTVLVKLSN
jgi:hypothetical protein